VTASGNVKMSFARVLGHSHLSMSVSSEARVGMPFTEIALALDTTASMTGGKLSDLKDAAKRLVDDAYRLPQARDRIKFSVVPFAQYVNVGLQYRNETWMNVPPDGTFWDPSVCWDHYPIISQTNCRQSTCTWWNDGNPQQYACQQCDTVYGPAQRMCGANVTNVWNGCAGSRNYPANMTPVANAGSRIPGVPNVQCTSPLMRLTDHESTIRHAIDDMTAVGETYVPSGIEWGWRVLAHNGPFGDAKPKSGVNSARKILVLMTDGSNTRSPTYPNHDGWDAASSNALTTEMCSKAKLDDIEIFTVAFDVNDQSIKNILQACAYEPSRFYDAANRSELYQAFDAISKTLVLTRIAK
jgi:Mg-chelatase subunit ChlD